MKAKKSFAFGMLKWFNNADYSNMTKNPIIIAGPCSAESKDQIQKISTELNRMGIPIFRAGLWKPRTQPGSFEGVGEKGIEWLKEIQSSSPINVATEVATVSQMEKVLEQGIDVVWIGARTTSNPFAMQELSNYLKTLPTEKLDEITIMIKNPLNYDIKLWAGAVERIKQSGVKKIWLILRGFTPCGKSVYRNTPFWSSIHKMKTLYPECIIIIDPSHIAGDKKYVLELSRKALRMGADGLMIECHVAPQNSFTDKAQQITPLELEFLLAEVKDISESSTSELESLRTEIDDIDECILNLLAKRMDISIEIGKEKRRIGNNVTQPQREMSVMIDRLSYGSRIGLRAQFTAELMNQIINESKAIQVEEYGL